MNKRAKLVYTSGPKKELVKQFSCQDIFAYNAHVNGRPFLSLLRADGDWSCSSNLCLNFNLKTTDVQVQRVNESKTVGSIPLCNLLLPRSELRQEMVQ
jgi:hypothetical protein